MPIATRTFRVFVSSTFEDLKAERDALQRDVFPKLRTLCEQHGARFQAIDLRWGVRDEAALDQQTMAICLREIQRSSIDLYATTRSLYRQSRDNAIRNGDLDVKSLPEF